MFLPFFFYPSGIIAMIFLLWGSLSSNSSNRDRRCVPLILWYLILEIFECSIERTRWNFLINWEAFFYQIFPIFSNIFTPIHAFPSKIERSMAKETGFRNTCSSRLTRAWNKKKKKKRRRKLSCGMEIRVFTRPSTILANGETWLLGLPFVARVTETK